MADDWSEQRAWAAELLGRAEELADIVQLLGADVLAPEERVTFSVAQMVREDFLQQSAFDEVDAFCPLGKQYWMLQVIRRFHEAATAAVGGGAAADEVVRSPIAADIGRMRDWPPGEAETRARTLIDRMAEAVTA